MTDDEIVAFILRHEGGYVDDPVDRGGCTKYGVTIPTLAEFRRVRPAEVACDDIKALTRDDAEMIALELYILRPGFYQIADWRLRLAVVDFGFHSGRVTACKALQRALGNTHVDGIFGRDTAWQVAHADAAMLRDKVIGSRLRLLGSLIGKRPEQARFARGWMARVSAVLEAA